MLLLVPPVHEIEAGCHLEGDGCRRSDAKKKWRSRTDSSFLVCCQDDDANDDDDGKCGLYLLLVLLAVVLHLDVERR